MRIAVPDLISNSYFPAVAAVELGCLKDEGIDAEIELLFPVDEAYRALARGDVDIVAGSAHSALAAFPDWRGVKLMCAQSQGMYWFLVLRSDLDVSRGEVSAVIGRRIGAAPWVDLGLKQLIVDAGLPLEDVEVAPVPGAAGAGTNFGLTAARALADHQIDGFWANGMGAAVAVRSGAGTMVLDARRGDGPAEAFHYTFASVAATDTFIDSDPNRARAVVRAVRRAQTLLTEDPTSATAIGKRIFPAEQGALIAELVSADTPFYSTEITEQAVAGLNRFALARGLLSQPAEYEQVVAVELDRS